MTLGIQSASSSIRQRTLKDMFGPKSRPTEHIMITEPEIPVIEVQDSSSEAETSLTTLSASEEMDETSGGESVVVDNREGCELRYFAS
jgi:hypothetical protein